MDALTSNENIWSCKIGGKIAALPMGADWPMRAAVERAFRELTGVDAEFTFSGWAAELTEGERAVVEHRAPKLCEIDRPHQYECKRCGIAPPTGASKPPTVAHLPTRCADEHQEITFVGERCPLCEALGLLAKEKATTERLEKRVKDARELLVAWFNYDSEDVQFQRPPTDATKRFLGIAAVTKDPVLSGINAAREMSGLEPFKQAAETNEAQCNGNCFLVGGPFVAEDPSCPKHGNR